MVKSRQAHSVKLKIYTDTQIFPTELDYLGFTSLAQLS